jgi:hypothetical protein
MEFYVGLDVSLKQTSICVVDQTGLREGVVDSDPEAISVFLKSKAPDAVRIGLEIGPTSTCLWTELKRLGPWTTQSGLQSIEGWHFAAARHTPSAQTLSTTTLPLKSAKLRGCPLSFSN